MKLITHKKTLSYQIFHQLYLSYQILHHFYSNMFDYKSASALKRLYAGALFIFALVYVRIERLSRCKIKINWKNNLMRFIHE